MIPELGLFSLNIALAFALLLSTVPLIGIYCRRVQLVKQAVSLSYGLFFFVSLSVCLLGYSFAVDDFSLMYVAQHSNSQLPLFFKIAALWGGHEGSMLFWVFSLAMWTAIVAAFNRRIDPLIKARVLAVLAMISVAFCLFILFYSNPFERLFPAALEGRDLNPMLQDIGMIIHPPLLYIGYVGFAVNFAFAVAALLSGRMDAAVASWSRPYALVSWIFLTAGIGLGSWWAYYELGWGGWWFWDPVENASLMPWLLGTALLHALIATERRGIFSCWSLLLSIFTFSLSLLGTFIVRSGVLTSVHAFAVDPNRGIVLLLMLGIAVIGALTLFALRVNIESTPVRFSLFAKETMLLLANVLLSVATLIVLLGTFYPMAFTLLRLGSISVGAPYFNITFVLPVLLALALMGFASFSRWKIAPQKKLVNLLLPLVVAAIGGICAPLLFNSWQPMVALAVGLALWLLLSGLINTNPLSLRRFGVLLAHGGVAVVVIGATFSSYYTQEISAKMAPGSSVTIERYRFDYQQTRLLIGPNYTAEQATIGISDGQRSLGVLLPERRHYNVRSITMSEPGIKWGLFADFYAVMGEKVDANSYAIRLYYKPFIRWIWAGGVLMILGGIFVLYGCRCKDDCSKGNNSRNYRNNSNHYNNCRQLIVPNEQAP